MKMLVNGGAVDYLKLTYGPEDAPMRLDAEVRRADDLARLLVCQVAT
ncbi:MAG: hypothetical protein AAB654_00835 [Acidobacteriota bacterium]